MTKSIAPIYQVYQQSSTTAISIDTHARTYILSSYWYRNKHPQSTTPSTCHHNLTPPPAPMMDESIGPAVKVGIHAPNLAVFS